MTGNRLYKSEKLCSLSAIDRIFREGDSIIAYPLRVAYKTQVSDTPGAKFLVSIPKKKIRTAVGRVLLRRRTREAYRLNRNILIPTLTENNVAIDAAFMYLAKTPVDYHTIEEKMKLLLNKLATRISTPPSNPTPEP